MASARYVRGVVTHIGSLMSCQSVARSAVDKRQDRWDTVVTSGAMACLPSYHSAAAAP